MKDKTKVLNTYGYMFDKLQLTRPPIRQTNCSLQFFLPTNFF